MPITSLTNVTNTFSKNPQTLPRHTVVSANLSFKSDIGTAVALGTAGTMTTLAKLGATATITQADTYVTVCDISGAGMFFHAISPADDATHTPTIRITIDGTVYTLTAADSISSTRRMVIGQLLNTDIETTATTLDTENFLAPGLYTTAGFADRDGGCTAGAAGTGPNTYIPSEDEMFAFNFPMLRFDYQLLVEMKTTGVHGTADPFNAGIALYRLDL